METEITLDLMMIVGTIIYLTLISPLLLRFSNYTPFILPHPQILFDPATIVIAGFTGSIIAVVILQITNLCSSKYVNSSLIKMNIFLATISVMSGTFQILLGRRESNPDYFG